MDPTELFLQFLSTIDGPMAAAQAVFVFLGAKVALAVLRAIVEKDEAGRRKFDLRLLPGYLVDDVLPYGGALLVLFVAGWFKPALMPAFTLSAVFYAGSLARECGAQFAALLRVGKGPTTDPKPVPYMSGGLGGVKKQPPQV